MVENLNSKEFEHLFGGNYDYDFNVKNKKILINYVSNQ